tara:strand:+ start:1876 stop:3015 length:1140 start_codon:yes stop_codon:yes gene_type:complete
MPIPYVNLTKQAKSQKKEIINLLNRIIKKGQFVGGYEIDKFEKNICKLINVKHCVALNSGTDALTLGLHLMGIKKGDEVITTPNSFIASAAAIVHLGAVPIFVDICNDGNIDPKDMINKISKKTKAIMPVHLSGRPCKMDRIISISKKYKIPIIEDAAQAIGTKFKNKFVGTFGKVGCFSAHPLKNLNAMGDSGYLVTDDKIIANKIKLLRNHGIKNRNDITDFGYVSRMDNFQAGILNLRLKKLKSIISKRRSNAKLYFQNLKKIKEIKLPYEEKNQFNSFHTFIILANKRDKLKNYLEKKKISTAIHYPKLIFDQKAYTNKFKKINSNHYPMSKYYVSNILTLPINEFVTKNEIKKISNEIINFYNFINSKKSRQHF